MPDSDDSSDNPPAGPERESSGQTSRFAALVAPARLWVPCAIKTPLGVVRVKPVGTVVAAGEALTESGAESEHMAVAPVAGRIVDVGWVTQSNLTEVPAVLLEAEHSEGVPEAAVSLPGDFGRLSIEAVRGMLSRLGRPELVEAIQLLRDAGVWADRWTSPDLSGQLHACLRRPADTVICNMLDADRMLGVNLACAVEYPAEIVAAVAALARLTGAARAWLAVDAEAGPETWAGIQKVAAQAAGDLRLVPVENHYPQPDPTLLLHSLTGRLLRPGRLPSDQGVVLLDAAAAVAVGRALAAGEPMLRVPLAIHDRTAVAPDGDDLGTTRLVSAVVGTPLRDILDRLGVGQNLGRRAPDLWAGAPLREHRLTLDCVVAGGELGIFVAPREPAVNPDPCIRCGWCVEGCPVQAHPAALLDAAQSRDVYRAESYGLNACIECGICSYVCPSHLPLLQGIRTLRRR